jgi:uncharacterized protein YjiS (DUF1127 family)
MNSPVHDDAASSDRTQHRSLLMEELAMLNGSLDAGRGALLTSPRAARAVRTVSAKNIWTALFNGARCVLRVWSMWQERSAGRDALVRLDHHMLRDIGLTRADVERELMKPFWRE